MLIDCPYCGNEYRQHDLEDIFSPPLEDGVEEEETECKYCGKKLKITREVSIDYGVEGIEEEEEDNE